MSLDPVLRARLRPPAVPADGIERPELLARAMRGLDDRLLVLLADAGYGKSTLLAQAAAQSELPVVWISCDAHVGSPSLLLSHLVAGLAERVPGFHVRQLRRSPLESGVEALARPPRAARRRGGRCGLRRRARTLTRNGERPRIWWMPFPRRRGRRSRAGRRFPYHSPNWSRTAASPWVSVSWR